MACLTKWTPSMSMFDSTMDEMLGNRSGIAKVVVVGYFSLRD